MFTRSVRKTLVFNTICTVCSTKMVYYIYLLCVKYGMHAYTGPACICRMHGPSMLIPPTQSAGKLCWRYAYQGTRCMHTICAYAYRQHRTHSIKVLNLFVKITPHINYRIPRGI